MKLGVMPGGGPGFPCAKVSPDAPMPGGGCVLPPGDCAHGGGPVTPGGGPPTPEGITPGGGPSLGNVEDIDLASHRQGLL